MRAGLVLVLLAGCPKARVDPLDEAMRAALVEADAAWRARGATGFEAVERALERVPAARTSHPEVAWRRVRLAVGRALTEDDVRARRRGYADARARGADCLDDESAVARALDAGDVPKAAAAVSTDRMACAVWTGFAWARWLGTLAPSAVASDVPGVLALLRRGSRSSDVELVDRVAWGTALAELARAAGAGTEAPRARAQLLDVARTDQDDAWVRWADVRAWVDDATPAPRRRPRTPEERAVAERLDVTP